MINLNNIINSSSQRIERKIILSKGQSNFFKYNLRDIGFSDTYEDRKVSSIYFDDIDLSALRDNIDGNKYRNKIRSRYYNDDLENWFIEIKQKRGFIGYKERINPLVFVKNDKDIIDYVVKWSKSNLDFYIKPTSKIMYSRSYFQKDFIRATVDINVRSFRLSSFGKKIFTSINDYEVIEFKYDAKYDEEFRSVFKNLNKNYIRATKSSKYSNSMMF